MLTVTYHIYIVNAMKEPFSIGGNPAKAFAMGYVASIPKPGLCRKRSQLVPPRQSPRSQQRNCFYDSRMDRMYYQNMRKVCKNKESGMLQTYVLLNFQRVRHSIHRYSLEHKLDIAKSHSPTLGHGKAKIHLALLQRTGLPLVEGKFTVFKEKASDWGFRQSYDESNRGKTVNGFAIRNPYIGDRGGSRTDREFLQRKILV